MTKLHVLLQLIYNSVLKNKRSIWFSMEYYVIYKIKTKYCLIKNNYLFVYVIHTCLE